MRALAIGAVLLYHAGIPGFEGGYVGVDVFFVISGFLITSAMLRELESTDSLSLTGFWARRAKRLLPAALFALAGAALISWAWLPITQRETFGGDIIAAATYVVNWRFSARSVDYLAEDVGVSPVQHFWSLAVEEQFYIVWPILFLVAVAVAKPTGIRRQAVIGAMIVVASVASLLWSITSTSSDPSTAFFSTLTRVWELGAGAGLALLWPSLTSPSKRAHAVAGWVGLGLIGYSVFAFSASTAWPSYRAAVPVLGAALVIVSGAVTSERSPAALLSVRPAVWVGGISYSLYLWHWPLLVGWEARYGELDALTGALVVAGSFIPAVLAQRFIEDPIRFARRMRPTRPALLVGAGCMVASIGVGLALIWSVPEVERPDGRVALGAQAVQETLEDEPLTTDDVTDDAEPEATDTTTFITPDPLVADSDLPDAYEGGCQVGRTTTAARSCVYGDPASDNVLMLVGDSKAVQWESALRTITERSGWQMVTLAKSGCSFSSAAQPRDGGIYDACVSWNDNVMEIIEQAPPDLVVVSGGAREGLPPGDPEQEPTREAMAEGYADRWAELAALDIVIAVIIDNPGPGQNMPECVANNRTELDNCRHEINPEFSAASTQFAAAEIFSGVTLIDPTPILCPSDCPPVIGNVLVHRQGSHLTRTFVDSLAPFLAEELGAISGAALS